MSLCRRKFILASSLNLFLFKFAKGQSNLISINYKLSPPPLDNYPEALSVLELKIKRTRGRISQIEYENTYALEAFWSLVGSRQGDYPDLAKKINESLLSLTEIVLEFKEYFNRARPSSVIPEINPILPVPWHASYPSGHATQSFVIASMMANHFPKYSKKLFNLAFQVGLNREIAGLHYRSDTLAGFELGRNFINFQK
jgi:acid phosphatase (class A)